MSLVCHGNSVIDNTAVDIFAMKHKLILCNNGHDDYVTAHEKRHQETNFSLGIARTS